MKTIKTIFEPTYMKFFASLLLCLTLVVSCSDDDDAPLPPNEEEVITDVTYTFVNDANAADTVVLDFEDSDGPEGPNAPVLNVTGAFTAGATYTATVEIFNSIEGEDITEEVVEDEPDEHFFIYASTVDMTFARSANDVVRTDGNSLGFETTWTANTAGMGTITAQLWHESETVDDSANGGLGAQTGGEDDFDITWNVEIQ